MAIVRDFELERAAERITATYDARQVVEEVFPDELDQSAFVEVLQELAADGNEIKAGGSRLRELVGCRRKDFSKEVVGDARDIAENIYPHSLLRLGPLVDILRDYPEEKLTKPDLDFFIWNSNPEEIMNRFTARGFKTSLHYATGGAIVINVDGGNGTATFVNGETSWQTGEAWPMFGFLAKFSPFPDPSFKLDIGYGRLYIYPLEIPGIDRKDPINPQRVAAIGRALLWGVTASPPNRNRLEAPLFLSQPYFFETVAALPTLIRDIMRNPELEQNYRSGLRDMALALRIIVLTDWYEEMSHFVLSPEHAHFYGQIQSIWQSELWKMSWRYELKKMKNEMLYDEWERLVNGKFSSFIRWVDPALLSTK